MTGKPVVGYDALKEPKSPKTRAEREGDERDEALRVRIREGHCLVADEKCRGSVEVAHVRSRGAGGRDWDNVVGLCFYHHHELHFLGRKTWEYRQQVNLARAAKQATSTYLRDRGFQ